MKKVIFLLIALSLAGVVHAVESIENSYIGINVRENDYRFAFDFGTSHTNTPTSRALLYNYTGTSTVPDITSKIVLRVDNRPYDMQLVAPPAVPMTNSGVLISGYKNITGVSGIDTGLNAVRFTAQWSFVNNPETGLLPDTMQMKFIAENTGSAVHDVALRLEIDTMVNGNDGTNVSIDNGFSVVANNSVWYKAGGIPANWWDYDIPPTSGTPTLVGRGHVKDNLYGDPATEPDIFEVASWNRVNDGDQWSLAVAPSAGTIAIGADSAIVFWWTNGQVVDPATGNVSSIDYTLNPGQSITWVTYYGINQGVLLATPTITPTYTITRTHTITPTHSMTPTISPTHTITETHTVTPTVTVTPTITPTALPCSFDFVNSFPNPFRYEANFVYKLTCPGDVEVIIFTVSGEEVYRGTRQGVPGYNTFVWDGKNSEKERVSSGTYIVKISTEIDREVFLNVFKIACVR